MKRNRSNNKEKTALICGITGQDGSYLARSLTDKGYDVWGTTRQKNTSHIKNLETLNIDGRVHLIQMDPNDPNDVANAITCAQPDEVYYLAGQSSVGLSFELPLETFTSITTGLINVLEECRKARQTIKIYNAGSGEIFGDTGDLPATEMTQLKPCSPYGVAKASAFWIVKTYRECFGMFACTGILFNHESPLRPRNFVTQKIIEGAKSISAGRYRTLELGRLDVYRDWGWAPEYVVPMWRMLQLDEPDDFIISSGTRTSLEEFCSIAFAALNLDWRDHVMEVEKFVRPNEIQSSWGNPRKAREKLEWQAGTDLSNIIQNLIDEKLS